METVHKIGRRKTAVARVYVSEGKGNITINKRELNNYFTTPTLQYKVQQPLQLTENLGHQSKCVRRWSNWTSRSNSFGNYQSFGRNQ
jgi:ribosomal protein S9